MRANILAGTIGLCMVGGVSQPARAAFLFHNDTAEPIVFNLQCGAAEFQTLSIPPHHRHAYRCANGARDARLEVYTEVDGAAPISDVADADLLVSDRVHDTESYTFFRDAVGYVQVVRFR